MISLQRNFLCGRHWKTLWCLVTTSWSRAFLQPAARWGWSTPRHPGVSTSLGVTASTGIRASLTKCDPRCARVSPAAGRAQPHTARLQAGMEGWRGHFHAGICSLSDQLVLSSVNSTAKASHCAQGGNAFPQSSLQRLAGPNYSSHHECLSLSHLSHADTQMLLI